MKTALLLLCLFYDQVAYTQDSTSKRPVLLYAVAIYDFAKSYGVSAGASIPFQSIISHKQHENLLAATKKDQFISVGAGMYRRPFLYTSAYLDVGAGVRFARSEKHYSEVSFEQGVLRTFYDGQVYGEQLDGTIKELSLFGRTYATTGFSYAQHWSLSDGSGNAWFILFKPCIWIQYPYNSFLKPHFSLQVGASYQLGGVTVHTRTKYKHQS